MNLELGDTAVRLGEAGAIEQADVLGVQVDGTAIDDFGVVMPAAARADQG